MTPQQIAYIARRRSQLRYWPWLALVMVLLLAAGYGWLWQHVQININPFLVLDQFHHKTVSDEEMIMLAARGSLAMVTCGLFLLLIILLVSVALLNEHRLLRILDQVAPPAIHPAAEATAAGPADQAEQMDPPERGGQDEPGGQAAQGAAVASDSPVLAEATTNATGTAPPPANG